MNKIFRSILVTVVLLCGFTTVEAQKVKSVKLLTNDKSAITKPRNDLNGQNCALIKLGYDDDISRIEGNIIGEIDFNGDEKWIYLTSGTKEMKVVPANQKPFTITFSRYGIRSVQGGKTYKVEVEVPKNEVTTEEKGYPCKNVETFTVEGVTFKMVKVKGGEFSMGATSEQARYAQENEKPVHQVVLNDYYIATTEVTQELWTKITGKNPSKTGGPRNPVECITKESVETFLDVLRAKTDLPFRLPTEAEWEYAARGGQKSKHTVYAGSNNAKEVACTIETNGKNKYSHVVGSYKPNELGIYDMSGNVWELTQDTDADYPDMKLYNPLAKRLERSYMVRGGSYMSDNKAARITCRYISEVKGEQSLGLRLALNALDGAGKEQALRELVKKPAQCLETKTAKGIQFTIDGVKFNMVKVDGGTFKMGAVKSKNAQKNEKPVHLVTLTDYYIGETEVTQELWQNIVYDSPFEFFGYQLPAETLSLQMIKVFLERLSNITGWQFDIPTEAQWEFAARGGNKSKGYMWSGSSKASEVLWAYANTGGRNQKVAQLKPNELGIYDMSGNVSEMCYYNGPYEKTKEPAVDPQGPNHGKEFVYRGGHTGLDFSSPWFCRVSAREGYMSDRNTRGLGESWVIGLRLVMKPKQNN